MADRFPLIVNPSANQIQELPGADNIVIPGQIKLTTTAASGSNGNSTIRITGNTSNVSKLLIDGRGDGSGAGGFTNIAEFKLTNTTPEFVSKGEITAVQPSCLLTVPEIYTADASTNGKPITFTTVTTNVGCTTSLAGTATSTTTGITSITVPSAGTYLVTAGISGQSNGAAGGPTDKIVFSLDNGSGFFPSEFTFPTFNFGVSNSESNCTFTLPLALSAGDTLSVNLSDIDATASASIFAGYFSVTKLH